MSGPLAVAAPGTGGAPGWYLLECRPAPGTSAPLQWRAACADGEISLPLAAPDADGVSRTLLMLPQAASNAGIACEAEAPKGARAPSDPALQPSPHDRQTSPAGSTYTGSMLTGPVPLCWMVLSRAFLKPEFLIVTVPPPMIEIASSQTYGNQTFSIVHEPRQ